MAIFRVDPNRNRPVVHRANSHVSSEHPRLQSSIEGFFDHTDKAFVQPSAPIGIGRLIEGGARPFSNAAEERKLADKQYPLILSYRPVHLSGLAFEDSKLKQLPQRPLQILFLVLTIDSCQHQQPRGDGPDPHVFDFDLCGSDAPDQNPHGKGKPASIDNTILRVGKRAGSTFLGYRVHHLFDRFRGKWRGKVSLSATGSDDN